MSPHLMNSPQPRVMGVKHSAKHPGFKAVQAKIAAKDGIPMKNAGAILATGSRKASGAAKKANPRLGRVKGG